MSTVISNLPAEISDLLATPVRRLLRRGPVTCSPDTPLAEAAARMEAAGVGSIVVLSEDQVPIGIVTDRDLRARVVAVGRSPSDPVRTVMSSPLQTIDADETAGEALVRMLRHNIHHLPVLGSAPDEAAAPGAARGRPVLLGVVSSQDFLAFRQVHPLRLLREIEEQADVAGLAAASARVHDVVTFLYGEGVPPVQMCRVISELHDAVVRRALQLAQAELAEMGLELPGTAWCWLALGSEGRREQTLRTDQDNALVYADPGAGQVSPASLERMTRRVTDILEACGIPRCSGGIMASEPNWRMSESGWMQLVADARRDPFGKLFVRAAALLDARPLAGDLELGRRLARRVREELAADGFFMRRMAEEVARVPLPLSPLGGLAVPRWGPQRGRLPIKTRALNPLVAGVRVMALEHGVEAVNTLERIEALTRLGALRRVGLAADLPQAFETLLGYRIVAELEQQAAGTPAHPGEPAQRAYPAYARLPSKPAAVPQGAALNVRRLSPSQKAALVSALNTVRTLQEVLRRAYAI